jgi:large subunit ribosomal protein L24
MILDPKDQKPTRVGYLIDKDGTKKRVARRSGEVLDKK